MLLLDTTFRVCLKSLISSFFIPLHSLKIILLNTLTIDIWELFFLKLWFFFGLGFSTSVDEVMLELFEFLGGFSCLMFFCKSLIYLSNSSWESCSNSDSLFIENYLRDISVNFLIWIGWVVTNFLLLKKLES